LSECPRTPIISGTAGATGMLKSDFYDHFGGNDYNGRNATVSSVHATDTEATDKNGTTIGGTFIIMARHVLNSWTTKSFK